MFQQQYQRPQQQEVDPYAPLRQEQSFFSEQDAFSLLKGEKPIDELNRMGNKIKQSVAEPLLGVIQQQKRELEEWRKQQQMVEMRRQQADEAQRANTQFFQDFPDLKPMESLVRLEAQYLAQEAQRNPTLLSGRTNQDAANMLAERVRKAAQGIAAAVHGGGVSSTPTRSPHLERGSTPRMPAPVKGDPNQSNLREMAGFMQNKKKRA
jgi:superfamily II RNA helicase